MSKRYSVKLSWFILPFSGFNTGVPHNRNRHNFLSRWYAIQRLISKCTIAHVKHHICESIAAESATKLNSVNCINAHKLSCYGKEFQILANRLHDVNETLDLAFAMEADTSNSNFGAEQSFNSRDRHTFHPILQA